MNHFFFFLIEYTHEFISYLLDHVNAADWFLDPNIMAKIKKMGPLEPPYQSLALIELEYF